MPNCTIEYLGVVAGVPNSKFKALWSSQATGGSRSLTVLTYESADGTLSIVPQGVSGFLAKKLPPNSKWVHIVVSYTHQSNLVQWYVNGEVSQSHVTVLQDGADVITLGGVTGTNVYDHISQSLAVFRVWNRPLSASEVYTLYIQGEHSQYTRPVVSAGCPLRRFDPKSPPAHTKALIHHPIGLNTPSQALMHIADNPVYATYRIHSNGSRAAVASGTVSSLISSVLHKYTSVPIVYNYNSVFLSGLRASDTWPANTSMGQSGA
jgi:hypothetical protein